MSSNTATPQLWQIASGDAGREYWKLFLEHDVMLIGPDWAGPYSFDSYPLSKGGAEQNAQIRQFCVEVKTDDLVLLRDKYRVVTVGVVSERGCSFEEIFDDVHGWSLRHCRRVFWQRQLCSAFQELQAGDPIFAGRKQIPSFTRVNEPKIRERVNELLKKCEPRDTAKLQPLPTVAAPLTLEQFGTELFGLGLANDAVDRVVTTLGRQRRLQAWYHNQGEVTGRPTEHELVAHMVLPLLLSLGWAEQLLAVEWNKIDLAGFSQTPTGRESCCLVCEAKRSGEGLGSTHRQALAYVEKHGLHRCRRILVTDGAHYYVYSRRDGKWLSEPTGYLNIFKLRRSHLLPRDTDAVKTLIDLTPAGVMSA